MPTSFVSSLLSTSLATRRSTIWCIAGSISLLLCGCGKQEEIETYTVATHESIQTPEYLAQLDARRPKAARMLAAIVPHGQELWFFKLQGEPNAVADRDGEFRDLLKTVEFAPSGKIGWKLPSGWKETPGNEMRYATLVLPGTPKLEVSVTTLPASGKLTQDLLANINRWRGQLDLPFIEESDLPTRTEKISVGELTISYLNIVGKAKAGGAMPGMPPMAGHGDTPPEKPVREERAKEAAPSDDASAGGIAYIKPKEWIQVRPKSFIIAAFEVVNGKQKASITLSRAGGSKSANINRWRGQLNLKPLSDAEVEKSLIDFPVGERMGKFVHLQNETQTMLGLMIDDGDQTVFVKLTGDPETAAQERARFEAFAQSLKF